MAASKEHLEQVIAGAAGLARDKRAIVTPEEVIKTGPSWPMYIECHKTICAREIALRSGLFSVPEVLSFDRPLGRLVLKRIPNLRTFNEALQEGTLTSDATYHLGVALAVIHRDLILPEEMRIILPDRLDCATCPKAYLHGDLTLHNVCLSRPSGELVILDWHMTDVDGGLVTYGTPHFDLFSFLNSLFYRTFLDARTFPHLADLGRSFIRGYFGSGWLPRQPCFEEYLSACVARRLAERRRTYSWKARVGFAPAEFLFAAFVRKLAHDTACV